jgi:hypothetical protein
MPGRQWVAGVVVATALAGAALASAAPAAADTLIVSSKPTAPSGVTAITFTAAWSTSSNGAHVTVSVENASIHKCPSSPSGGRGIKVIDTVAAVYGAPAKSEPSVFEHGRYLVCGWLIGPSSTLATDHHSLSVSNPDHLGISLAPNVIDGTTTPLTFSGIADVANPVIVIKRNDAAHRCSAAPKSDPGQPLSGAAPAPGAAGVFTSATTITPGAGPSGAVDSADPGDYTVCAWLLDGSNGSGDPLAPPASAPLTLTAPTGTLAFTMPELVRAGHRFGVAAKYDASTANVKLYVDLKLLPAAGPLCAGSHAQDAGAVKLIVGAKRGVKTTRRVRLSSGGVYVACAWLEWSHGTIDGPFSGRVVVARAHQRPTYWCGNTSQRLRPSQTHHARCSISFETIDGQVVYLSYWAGFTCTASGHLPSHKIYTTSFPVFAMSAPKAFVGTYDQGSDHAAVDARLRRKRGRGTLSEEYRSDGYTCATGTVAFKVRRE